MASATMASAMSSRAEAAPDVKALMAAQLQHSCIVPVLATEPQVPRNWHSHLQTPARQPLHPYPPSPEL